MDGYVCMCIPYTYKFHTIHERSESVLSQTSSEGVKWAKEGKRDGKWERRGEERGGGREVVRQLSFENRSKRRPQLKLLPGTSNDMKRYPKSDRKSRQSLGWLAISQAKTKPTKLQSPITSCGKEKEASNPQSNATESRALAIIIASRMDGWAEE